MPVLQTGLAKSAAEDYTIDQSLRFDEDSASKLSRTFTSTGNRKTWTLSTWVKLSGLDTTDHGELFNGYDSGSDTGFTAIYWYNGKLRIAGWSTTWRESSQEFRDPSAWYHLVVAFDTTEDAADDRCKIYVNGSQVTSFGTNNTISADTDYGINGAWVHQIGQDNSASSSRNLSGYLAEVYFIDGTALDASSFGETDTDTNQWKPIDASDLTFGTNGFYQKYSSTELATSFADSAEGHVVTANGNVHTDTSVKKIGTASAQFDGTGDYLSVPDSSDWNIFGSGDWTTETWVKLDNHSQAEHLFGQYEDSSNKWEISHNGAGSNNGLEFGLKSGGSWVISSGYASGGSGEITDTDWHHVALVKESDDYTMYLDGTALDNTVNDSDTDDISGPLSIGQNGASGSYLTGYLDEIRISDSARYTSSFTPSTTAFTNDTNTMLLLHCDGSDSGTTFTDSSTRPRHTITANGDVTNTRAQSKVGDSSIYFDGTGDYLSVPDSDDFDFTSAFTIEFWFRTSDSTTTQAFYVKRASEIASNIRIGVGSVSGKLEVLVSSGTSSWDIWLNQSVADISNDTWYHVALTWDGSTYTIWLDGVSQDTSTDSNYPTVNTASVYLGARQDGTQAIDGYLDEIRISDTARYTTTFTPSTTEFTADANTMLLIHSNWDGGIGADRSGNENDFAVTNLVATDQMVDSPTNNFATLNPLQVSGTLSEGNLKVALTTTQRFGSVSTMAPVDGKWYAEIYLVSYITSPVWMLGITSNPSEDWRNERSIGSQTYSYSYDASTGVAYNNDASVPEADPYGDTAGTGDILGIGLDLENNKLYFSVNGTWQNSANPASGTGGIAITDPSSSVLGTYAIGTGDGSATKGTTQVINFGQDSSFAGAKTAQGNQDSNSIGDFYYEPPTDYLALCTSNLASPEIALPTDHFNTVLYDGGDVTGSVAVTGAGFRPDLVWLKTRDHTYFHQAHDSVRGASSGALYPNASNAEVSTLPIASFDSDGFSTGTQSDNTGQNDDDMVAWNWLAGGTAASNTDGSITSSVSANPTAGFSIVAYTGTGSAATVGHGLSSAPELIITKKRSDTASNENWFVAATPIGTGNTVLELNSPNDAATPSPAAYDDPHSTASVVDFETNQNVNDSGETFIMYCFHSVEGYSKVGSYVGNGDADGVFIQTGMKPALVIVKRLADEGWQMFDSTRSPYNVAVDSLTPNGSGAERTDLVDVDIVSNGFKFRGDDGSCNASDDYIYYAVAESPFKTSNAR